MAGPLASMPVSNQQRKIKICSTKDTQLARFSFNNNMFSKGEKVQAIDQVGRWENGRVIGVRDEGEEVGVQDGEQDASMAMSTTTQCHIRFTGWGPAYDLWLPLHKIRRPVQPMDFGFESVIGKYPLIFCKSSPTN